jgi:hypothetical protein
MPALAYRYGTMRAQARIAHTLLNDIEVGDSIEPVRERVPALFPNDDASYAASAGEYSYYLRLERDKVAELHH